MPHSNIITGNSDDEIWEQISSQINEKEEINDYSVQFESGKDCITIHIDFHPDGRENNLQPTTSFISHLPAETNFRFRIQKQNLKHEIGKLFGMQDVIIGDPEFDKKFLIESNDVDKVKEVLSQPEIKSELLKQPIINLEIADRKFGAHREIVLTLDIKGGMRDPAELKSIYRPFKQILNFLSA
jgi:hypothetical protein